MKTLLSLLLITSLSFSQVTDLTLCQTWYLITVQSNDFATTYNSWQITPTITPTLTINATGTFTGTGACNTFTGSLNNANPNQLLVSSFTGSGLDCGYTMHNQFEGNYFSFLNSASYYQFSAINGGLLLMMNNALMGYAQFQNFPLDTTSFESNTANIYPNPVTDMLFVDANALAITKVEICNTLGQTVKIQPSDLQTIPVSDITPGLYILKVYTETGTISKKFIKK